jgi:hypothetical protein
VKRSWVLLFALVGCAGPLKALRVETPMQLEGQAFVLRTHELSPPADTQRIQNAITQATPALARWGGLIETVTVYVVKSHDDLETAVRRTGFAWLRAWGRYDDVIFQTPSTWTTRDEFVNQLVLHELTHCLLFQRSGTRETWYLKEIPLWFREGMAIATAGQSALYPSLEDSALWLERNPTLDAFKDGEALSEKQSSEVYGIGLHAFVLLVERQGEERIVKLMEAMHAGSNFEEAFVEVMGFPVENFRKQFENHLRLRSFRHRTPGYRRR